MAVFQKIRDNSLLSLILVGGSLFLFIIGDAFSSGGSLFAEEAEAAGNFDGQDISVAEFDSYYSKVLYLNGQAKSSDMTDAQKQNFSEQSWSQLVLEKALGKEATSNGITITDGELEEMMVGDRPFSFYIYRLFGGIEQYQSNKAKISENIEDFAQYAAVRDESEAELLKNLGVTIRQQEKMISLLNSAFFTTTSEALNNYEGKYTKKNVQIASVPYYLIPDSLVEVTDADVKKFYSVNKGKYKYRKPSQKVIYGAFRVDPTPEDDQDVRKWAAETVSLFKEEKNDELFIKTEGELPVDRKYYKQGDGLSAELDTALFGKEEGYVYGPYSTYKDGNKTYNVAKVLAVQQMADSAKVSHILLTPEDLFQKLFAENPEPKEEEQTAAWKSFDALADSVLGALNDGADFSAMAVKFSKDTATANKGGDLGWIQEQSQDYSRNFLDSVFIGDYSDSKYKKVQVVTNGGRYKYFQFVKITKMGEKQEKIKVGIVDKSVLPGRKTRNNMFNKINQVAIALNGGEDLKSLVDSFGILIDSAEVQPQQYVVNDLKGGRKLVRWAFKEGKDDARVFEFDRKYVAAIRSGEPKTGYKSLSDENVKGEIENKVRKLKKAQYVADQLGEISELTDVSKKFAGARMNNDSAVVVAEGANGLKYENKVSGVIASLSAGQVSSVVAGSDGAYVVKVLSADEAKVTEDTNFDVEKRMIAQENSNKANYVFQELIDEKAEVEDNRQALH